MLKELLIQDEGLKLARYKDSMGIDTIGVGRNLRDKGLSAEEAKIIGSSYPEVITFDEAMMLLDHDISEVSSAVFDALPWAKYVPEVAQWVLISMAFNMGLGGLLKFKIFLRAIQDAKYDEASDAMLDSLWARQLPNRSRRLAGMILNIKKGGN